MKAAPRRYDGYEMATSGVMWVQGNYKRYGAGYEAATRRHGGYEAATRGTK